MNKEKIITKAITNLIKHVEVLEESIRFTDCMILAIINTVCDKDQQKEVFSNYREICEAHDLEVPKDCSFNDCDCEDEEDDEEQNMDETVELLGRLAELMKKRDNKKKDS